MNHKPQHNENSNDEPTITGWCAQLRKYISRYECPINSPEMCEKNRRNVAVIAVIVILNSFALVLLTGPERNTDERFLKTRSNDSDFHSKNSAARTKSTSMVPKLLVAGSTWFGQDKDWNKYFVNCQEKCIFSPDSRLIPVADAVLFHYNLPWEKNYYNQTVHGRRSNQRFISYTQESPLSLRDKFGSSYKEPFLDFYNWTFSYRLHQTISYPYGKAFALNSTAIDPNTLRNITSRKTKTGIWIASHCDTFSKREVIMKKLLLENLTIDIWGSCGKDYICPRINESICEEKIESDYFFFFAFENSICQEYVTEKLYYRASKYNSVPVVLKRKIAEDVGFPGDGIIAVDDFSSISELGNFLAKLQRNLTKYEEYFQWKSRYQIAEGNSFAWCDLCSRLWDDTEPAVVADVSEIFLNTKECYEPPWR